jgi:integrase
MAQQKRDLPKGIREHHGKYQLRYTVNGRSHTESYARLTDAKNRQQEIGVSRRRGTWVDPSDGRITVAEWAPIWFESKVDLRRSSNHRLQGILRTHVLPEFADTSLVSITNSGVRAWVARLNATNSAGTTRKAFFALSQMLDAAVADRRIAVNPCKGVPLPSVHHDEQRFLDRDEVETLADCIHPRLRAAVLLSAYGGLRFGELAGLRRKRIDLLRGRVTVAEVLEDVGGHLSFGPPKTK